MTNEPIEERLTAYVLGELSEAEQGSVEKLLKEDEDAKRMLEEIRAAVGLSQEALKTQPSVALWSEQRAAINRVIASPRQVVGLGGRESLTYSHRFLGRNREVGIESQHLEKCALSRICLTQNGMNARQKGQCSGSRPFRQGSLTDGKPQITLGFTEI